MERKTGLIAVRIPISWKMQFRTRGINVSYICRSALFQAIQKTDLVLKTGSLLHSKQRAASLWASLMPLTVRTIHDFETRLLKESPFKLQLFREKVITSADSSELQVLGEFLDQGEFAEEILQDVYV